MFPSPISRTPSPPVIFPEISTASSSNASSSDQSSAFASINPIVTRAVQRPTESNWSPIKRLVFPPTNEGLDCHAPLMKGMAPWENIPEFAIITGRNGSGKSQLLDWLHNEITKRPDHHLSADQKNPSIRCVYKTLISFIVDNPSWEYSQEYGIAKIQVIFDFYADQFRQYNEIKKLYLNYVASLESYASSQTESLAFPEVELNEFLKYSRTDKFDTNYANESLPNWDLFIKELQSVRLSQKRLDEPWNKLLSFIKKSSYIFEEPIYPGIKLNDLLEKTKIKLSFLGDWNESKTRIIFPYAKLWDGIKNGEEDRPTHFTRKQANGLEERINMQLLSSGERLVIDIFASQYYYLIRNSSGYHSYFVRPNIILLDEPDRHLDPELCKILMIYLQEIVATDQIQIIMTTHRTDTLAYAPEGSIFTIKREESGVARIEPTSRLNALFRLTPNLRDITNFHIKVYTESLDDATFYEMIYRQLLRFSEHERSKGRLTPDIKPIILSRRFSLSFYSLALTRDSSGGGWTAIPQTIQRDIQAFNNLDRSKVKTFIERGITHPLGLMDADTELDADRIVSFSQRLVDFKEKHKRPNQVIDEKRLEERISFTKRYNLENYLYDPALLFSLLSESEINEWFAWNEEFRDHALACHRVLNVTHIDQESLQNTFDAYFRYFITQFVSIKVINIKNLQNFNSLLPLVEYNKIYGYIKILPVSNAGGKNKVDVAQKLAEDLEVTFAADDSDDVKRDKIVEKLFKAAQRKVTVLTAGTASTCDINYPGFFIYATGHVIESFIQRTFAKDKDADGNTFKKWLVDTKIAGNEKSVALPLDLVEVLRELNTRARAQGNAVIKPEVIKNL